MWRGALGLLLATSLQAGPDFPKWGVGLFAGQETGNQAGLCGRPFGFEASWHFLQGHWVEGRLRGTFLRFGYGDGVQTRSPAYVYRYKMRADYLVIASDWVFCLQKPRGPYLVAGVGWHLGEQEFREDLIPIVPEALPEVRTNRETSNFFAFSVGLGYQIQNRVEVELRWDFLPDAILLRGWGSGSVPYEDVSALNLAVRVRF